MTDERAPTVERTQTVECTGGLLPHRGQIVRLAWAGEVVSARVAWTCGWDLRLVAETDPGPAGHDAAIEARLVWRGETHAMCVDGIRSPGDAEWTITCDPATLTTLEERARRRVAVRAPVGVTVPSRLSPQVGMTWSINLSESGVALEPCRGLLISTRDTLVLRLGFDDLPALTVGRVVAAGPDQPVRVAFERMSPTTRSLLIGVVNRLEACSRAHAR